MAETPSFADVAERDRARQLLEEGARQLAALWDDGVAMCRLAEAPAYHSPRATLGYIEVLLDPSPPLDLAASERKSRAERALAAVLALQESNPDHAHHGNFKWLLEDETVRDLNGVEFMLDGLVPILREHGGALSPELRQSLHDAIVRGLDAIDRLDVHASYTNIYLSDICNSVLGGEATGLDAYVERGRRRLDEWFAFTDRSGAPHEYNSPTYMAVDIMRMAAVASHTQDGSIAFRARVAEERLWIHVALHFHPGLAQLAGPHSRSYFDGWSGAGGYLKLILWRLLGGDGLRPSTPYAARTREEGHVGVARADIHVPDFVMQMLRGKRYPFKARETADAVRGNDLTTYMTDDYALGTATRAFAVGELPEPWPQPNGLLLQFRRDAAPGYGTLLTRYVINDKGFGEQEAGDHAEDWWEEGQFVGVQHGGIAIVAYGLYPRVRPVRSYKLSVRVLGAGETAEVWVGDRRITAYPAPVSAGEPVVIAEGGVYLGIVAVQPSDMGAGAPIELLRDDLGLTLDIYNYRGPAKTFWEHRTQSGPFFKGNVRNAFALEVASREDFDSTRAFREHMAAARIADSVDDDYEREIAYSSATGSASLRYSLRDMRVIERKHGGVPYAAPMSDASGPAGSPGWIQSRDSLIERDGVTLMAGRNPKQLFHDVSRGRYVVYNTSDEEVPLWLESPAGTAIECDAIGFARVDLDESAGTVRVEADGYIGIVRIRSQKPLRLTINGADVTESMTQDGEFMEFAGIGVE